VIDHLRDKEEDPGKDGEKK